MDKNGTFDERAAPICFALEITDPSPPRILISKKNYCLVAVGPEPQDWAAIDMRKNYLEHFCSYSQPTWSQ